MTTTATRTSLTDLDTTDLHFELTQVWGRKAVRVLKRSLNGVAFVWSAPDQGPWFSGPSEVWLMVVDGERWDGTKIWQRIGVVPTIRDAQALAMLRYESDDARAAVKVLIKGGSLLSAADMAETALILSCD